MPTAVIDDGTVHVDKLQQRVNDIGDLSCRFKLLFIIHYKLHCRQRRNVQ